MFSFIAKCIVKSFFFFKYIFSKLLVFKICFLEVLSFFSCKNWLCRFVWARKAFWNTVILHHWLRHKPLRTYRGICFVDDSLWKVERRIHSNLFSASGSDDFTLVPRIFYFLILWPACFHSIFRIFNPLFVNVRFQREFYVCDYFRCFEKKEIA